MWKCGANPIPSFDYSENQFPFTRIIPPGGFLRPLPPHHSKHYLQHCSALLTSSLAFLCLGYFTDITVWVTQSWAFVVVVFWEESVMQKETPQNHIEKAVREKLVGNEIKMSSLLPKQGFDCCFTRGVVLFLIVQSSHSLERKIKQQKTKKHFTAFLKLQFLVICPFEGLLALRTVFAIWMQVYF